VNIIGKRVVPFTDAWCIKKDGPCGDNGVHSYLIEAVTRRPLAKFYAVSEPYTEEVETELLFKTQKYKFLFIDVKSSLTENVYRTNFSEDMVVEDEPEKVVEDEPEKSDEQEEKSEKIEPPSFEASQGETVQYGE